MIVENLNTNGRSSKHEILSYAQTISNFFIEALDQNDCNVKVVVGYYQELDDTIGSIIDLDDAFKNPSDIPNRNKPYKPPLDINDIIEKPLESDFITAAAVEALKERCFDCNLKLPRINFSNDLDFLHNKLQLQLDAYKNTFQNPFKGNYCHLAASMQYTCIPDIVKLLGMILTAYAAVLALNKLPSFSLNAFIKGVVGTLIAKCVGSLSISLDASSTGLPCLLGVLEELAYNMPTYDNVTQRLSEEQLANWVQDTNTIEEIKVALDNKLEAKEITLEEYDQIIDAHRKQFDPINFYAEKLEAEVGKKEEAVSSIFEYVNNILGSAQDDINSYISAVLGVINFFECENKRSGPDFTEVMEYIQNLTTVINIFSALIAIIVPKTIFWELCKDEKSYKELVESLSESKVNKPLTKLELEEILTEFNQNKTEIAEDGLSVIIYDKPVKSRLPKLELMGCNFKEFAEAHSLENIVKGSIEDYLNSEASKRDEINPEYEYGEPLDKGPGFNYIYDKNNKSLIDKLINKPINKFTPTQIVDSTLSQLNKPISRPGIGGSALIDKIKNKDKKDLQNIIDNNFKNHGFIKEDFNNGEQVFHEQYVHSDRLYDYIKYKNNSNLINGVIPEYNGGIGTGKLELDFVQKSRDYVFGSFIIDKRPEIVLPNSGTSKGDSVKYTILERVPVQISDIIGENNDFSNVLDGILDFIYNDPKPATNVQTDLEPSENSNIEDILSNDKDLDKGSIEPETNFEEELSIYTRTSKPSSITKSLPTGAECRSIEDVMNILKNINI